MSTAEEVARAYDAIAADYDDQMAGDSWMRRVLWDHYAAVYRAGQHVLDAGCGTGIDAVFLAGRGVRVTAIDVSPAMVARLREKVAAAGVSPLVESHILDMAALDGWPAGAFDGIISAFAGLSTVPTLAPFATTAARLLRPEGRLIVHLLNRWNLWEWIGLVGHGDWRHARALGRTGTRRFTIGAQMIQHYPYSPDEAYRRFFAPQFTLRRVYGLGNLRPPHTVRRIPPLAAGALGTLERRLPGQSILAGWSRFFVLDLARRNEPTAQ